MNQKQEPATILADALERCLISPNVSDSNFEAANVVDTLDNIAQALHRIAGALERLSATDPPARAPRLGDGAGGKGRVSAQ